MKGEQRNGGRHATGHTTPTSRTVDWRIVTQHRHRRHRRGTTRFERGSAERLRARLAAGLTPEIYQAAWAQGQARQLEAVVASLGAA